MGLTVILDENTVIPLATDWRYPSVGGRNIAYYSFVRAVVWARLIWNRDWPWYTAAADAPDGEPWHPGSVPGSLIQNFEEEVPVGFPEELLVRELFVHAAFARKYLGTSTNPTLVHIEEQL